MRPHPIFTLSRLVIRRLNQNYSASDWSEELNLGMKMFTIIILSGVEHGSKVRVAIAALKIKITQLLIEVRN